MSSCDRDLEEIKELCLFLPKEKQKIFKNEVERLKTIFSPHVKKNIDSVNLKKPFLRIIDEKKARCTQCGGIIQPIELYGGTTIFHCCSHLDEKQAAQFEKDLIKQLLLKKSGTGEEEQNKPRSKKAAG